MNQKLQSTSVSYDLTELLGEGLNGIVYKAVRSDPFDHVRQTVALKILKSKNLVEIWKREFESLAKVYSPHCVRVFGFEWVNDKPALVLEYVPGVTLRQFCLSGSITPGFAEEILAQIQLGLDDLHRQGLVHGDLSPNNVMISNDGTVKLLDFGCAFEGRVQATIDFAAPEVLKGRMPTPAADLYSLGQIEKMLTKTETSRISEAPLRRMRLDSLSVPAQRKRLGLQVQNILDQQNQFRDLATKSLVMVRKAIFPARKFALIFCLALIAPNAQTTGFGPLRASVRVRTTHWTKIGIDDEALAFTPQDLLLREGPHRLKWESGPLRGEIRFTLKPGEHRLFKDGDFTHHGDIAL